LMLSSISSSPHPFVLMDHRCTSHISRHDLIRRHLLAADLVHPMHLLYTVSFNRWCYNAADVGTFTLSAATTFPHTALSTVTSCWCCYVHLESFQFPSVLVCAPLTHFIHFKAQCKQPAPSFAGTNWYPVPYSSRHCHHCDSTDISSLVLAWRSFRRSSRAIIRSSYYLHSSKAHQANHSLWYNAVFQTSPGEDKRSFMIGTPFFYCSLLHFGWYPCGFAAIGYTSLGGFWASLLFFLHSIWVIQPVTAATRYETL
jgi:hypothetical protein